MKKKKPPKTKNQFLEGARDSHEEHRTSDFSYSFKFTSLFFFVCLGFVSLFVRFSSQKILSF